MREKCSLDSVLEKCEWVEEEEWRVKSEWRENHLSFILKFTGSSFSHVFVPWFLRLIFIFIPCSCFLLSSFLFSPSYGVWIAAMEWNQSPSFSKKHVLSTSNWMLLISTHISHQSKYHNVSKVWLVKCKTIHSTISKTKKSFNTLIQLLNTLLNFLKMTFDKLQTMSCHLSCDSSLLH